MKKMTLIMIATLLLMFCIPAYAAEFGADLPKEFFSWEMLGSYAGAAVLVALITQLTKELEYIKKIPTQVWSYILAVLILLASLLFTGRLTAASACLTLANGVLVSLAANGGYSLISRIPKAKAEVKEAYEIPALVEMDLNDWKLEELQMFCGLYKIPADGCETKEDFISAIDNYMASLEVDK